jgi:AsmA protein
MIKWIKRLLSLSLILLLLITVSLIILTKTIDPNRYRNQIESFFYHKTGRSLDIAGNIHWSFFPTLGIIIPDVTIGNPKSDYLNNNNDTSKQAFAKIGEIKFEAKFLPLFMGRVEISDIHIDHANIKLIQYSAATNNWGHWAEHQPRLRFYASLDKKATLMSPKKDINLPVRQVEIQNLSVTNSQIDYQDLTNKNHDTLSGVQFYLRNFKPDSHSPVSLSFTFKRENNPNQVNINIESNAHLKKNFELLELKEFTLKADWLRPNTEKLAIQINTNITATNNTNKKQISFNDLEIGIATMRAHGEAHISSQADQALLDWQLATDKTALKPFLMALSGDKTGGRFSGDLSSKTQGQLNLLANNLMDSLNANLIFTIHNGRLDGINLAALIQKAKRLIKGTQGDQGDQGTQSPDTNSSNYTDFNQMTGTIHCQNGHANNQDLIIEFAPYIAKGAGQVAINAGEAGKIDYELNLQDSKDSTVVLPIMISGTLSHPVIRPDFEKIAGQYLKNQIKNQLENVIKNPKEQWKENWRDRLKQLIP